MNQRSKNILIATAAVLFCIAAWFLSTIIIYIIISLILSLIGQPLFRFFSKARLGKIRLSPALCSLFSLLTMIFAFGCLFYMFIPLVVEEARLISHINPNDVLTAFREPLQNLEYDLQKYQISYGNGTSMQSYLMSKLASILGFQEISRYAGQMISFTGSIIAGFFSISFITFFLMKDEKLIYNVIILLTPPKYIDAIKEIMHDTKTILTRYFLGIIIDMLFVATTVSIGLSILGVNNALLIGIFAGIMNVIPYVGPLLGAGFAILIGVSANLQLDFYTQLIPLIEKIGLVFVITQLIDAFLVQPLLISSTVKAHPLEIFLVILIAGTFAGITGMIVAIPVYTIIRIIAKEFLYNFRIVQKLTEDLENATTNKTGTP
jgi:predicted PurR-regulated permease PerM